MRVPITFRDQPQHERSDHEHDYSFLSRCEAESLPHIIEFETPALLDHDLESSQSTTQRNFGFQPETSRAGFPACSSRGRQGCLFDETGTMPVLQPK